MMKMKAWLPVVVYAVLLVCVSSIPARAMPVSATLWSFDKVMHFAAYAGLGFFVARALWIGPPRLRVVTALIVATAAAAGFGVFDELYQSMTPGRASDPRDAAADSAGALAGAVALTVMRWRFGRRQKGE